MKNKGGRGRKTPAEIRLVQGNPREKPIPEPPKSDPAPAGTQPPYELTDRAREVWDRVTEQTDKIGLLTILDLDALAKYCELEAKWWKLQDRIEQDGMWIERRSQYDTWEVTAPWVKDQHAVFADILKLCKEFGFTPVARMNIIAPVKDKTGDHLEDFLFGSVQKKKA